MDFPLRRQIRRALLQTGVPALRVFADAIARLDGDRMACWGDLADHVIADLERDEDRLALWRVLAEIGERRALLVFLDVSRDRPGVLRAILGDAERLSPSLQCALVSMREVEPLLEGATEHLGAAARELVVQGVNARVQERALYEAHMSALRGQRAATFSSESIQSNALSTEVAEALSSGDPR